MSYNKNKKIPKTKTTPTKKTKTVSSKTSAKSSAKSPVKSSSKKKTKKISPDVSPPEENITSNVSEESSLPLDLHPEETPPFKRKPGRPPKLHDFNGKTLRYDVRNDEKIDKEVRQKRKYSERKTGITLRNKAPIFSPDRKERKRLAVKKAYEETSDVEIPNFEPMLNWHPMFIAAYRIDGIVKDACEAAGISRCMFHKELKNNPKFAQDCLDAQEDALDDLERNLIIRAKLIDTPAAIYLLKNKRYRERSTIEISGLNGGPIQSQQVESQDKIAIREDVLNLIHSLKNRIENGESEPPLLVEHEEEE